MKEEKNIGDEQISDMLIELFEGVCLRKVLCLLWEWECVVWMKEYDDGRVNP